MRRADRLFQIIQVLRRSRRPVTADAMAAELETSKRTIYFGGDSGYFHGFAEIGERFGPIDEAIIPIGAYEPRWFMAYNHMNVDEALLNEVVESHPGVTKTELIQRGLRALLARDAADRLAALGGTAPRARRPKRSAWKKA